MRRWWGKVLSSRPTRNTVLKFFRFMAAGLPGLAVAVPLNLLLVEVVGLHKVLAYLLVLVVQISINFLACLVFVFERDRSKSLLSQYLGFTRVVGIARVLDWALYSALTSLAGLNYILVQLMNAGIFGIGKFVFTRKVVEGQVASGPPCDTSAKSQSRPSLGQRGSYTRSALLAIRSVWNQPWAKLTRPHLWILAVYSGLTFVMVYLPVSINITTTYLGHGEVVFWSNYFWWFEYAISNSLNPLVHTYIFHPLALPMSDGILPFLLFTPITRFFGSIVSYNLYVLFTFAMSGYGMFALAKFLLKDSHAAFIAGVVFAFFPFGFGAAFGHLHTYSIMWVPFAVLWLCKLYEKPSAKNAVWLGVFLVLSALTSSTVTVMLALFMLIFVVVFFRQTLSRKILQYMAVAVFAAAILTLPVLHDFVREVVQNPHMGKPLHSFVTYSADLLGFIVPSPIHPVFGSATDQVYRLFTGNYSENIVFMGYLVILLSSVGALSWWRQTHGKVMILASLIFFVLSLGPVLHVRGIWQFTHLDLTVMLPGVLAYSLPILDMIRVPSRYVIMLMFTIALMAGYGWRSALRRFGADSQRRITGSKMLLTAVVVAFVLFEYAAVLPTQDAVPVPDTYSSIREDHRGGSVLEIPLCLLGGGFNHHQTMQTMIRYYEYQKTHERPIWGGYWSRSTPMYLDYLASDPVLSHLAVASGYQDIIELGELGTTNVLSYLRQKHDVAYVIVHKTLLPSEDVQSIVHLLGDGYIEDRSSPNDHLFVYDTRLAPDDYVEPDSHVVSIRLGDGWNGLERWNGVPARWMSSEAELIMTVEERGVVELTFTARSFLADRTLELILNGSLQRSVTIPPSPTLVTAMLTLEPGENTVHLRSLEGAERPSDHPEVFGQDHSDFRDLSFGIQHIAVRNVDVGQ